MHQVSEKQRMHVCCHFSHVQLCNPMDYSLPGSFVHGDSPGKNTVPCPPPEDLPDPGTEAPSLKSPALAGDFLTTSATWEALRNSVHAC